MVSTDHITIHYALTKKKKTSEGEEEKVHLQTVVFDTGKNVDLQLASIDQETQLNSTTEATVSTPKVIFCCFEPQIAPNPLTLDSCS